MLKRDCFRTAPVLLAKFTCAVMELWCNDDGTVAAAASCEAELTQLSSQPAPTEASLAMLHMFSPKLHTVEQGVDVNLWNSWDDLVKIIYICIILGWRCSLFFVPKSTAGGGSHPEGTGSHGAEEVWAVAFRDPGAWCRPRMTNLLGTTWNNLEQLCINYVSVWFSLLLDGVTHAGLWAMRSGQTCWDEEADCDRQRCSARIYI